MLLSNSQKSNEIASSEETVPLEQEKVGLVEVGFKNLLMIKKVHVEFLTILKKYSMPSYWINYPILVLHTGCAILSNHTQYVFINGFSSNRKLINCGIPYGSVLGSLLFLTFINDLNVSIKSSSTFHFVDDSFLLHVNKSIKAINDVCSHLSQRVSYTDLMQTTSF